MKKILIRIIVAVVVAFIFSKLKLLGIMDVSALEVYKQSVNDICYYNQSSTLVGCPGISSININNIIPFNESYYSTSNNFKSYSFLVPGVSSLNNKVFSARFVIATTTFIGNVGQLSVYAQDGNKNVSVCSVSPVGDNEIGTYKFFSVECDNLFQNGSIRFFVSNSLTFQTPGSFAVSNVSYFYDNDILLAQRQANTYLNDLKTSLSSIDTKLSNTNSKLDSLIQGIMTGNGLQTQIQNNTKETNDLIKSEDSIDNSKITDITNMNTNTSNTPVSDFLTLPMTLLGKYKDGMNSSCSPVSFGSLLGTNLSFPCINVKNYLGDNLWRIIDLMCSLFMVYNIAMLCISIWEGITSLHDDFYGAYSPQHGVGGRVERGELGGLY